MADLRPYRLGFAPTLAALVVLAFSLDGAPPPVEPGPVTLTFDQARAATTARVIAERWPDRSPGSEGDLEAADFVRGRFEALESGEVAEQEFDAGLYGEDETLRNVTLTLPGTSERTIVVLAGRDSRAGPGASSSAAATGVLLELAQQLGVSDRERTIVLASTDAASAGAEGAREVLAALPDADAVEAVVAISQPGSDELRQPHLVTSAAGERSPPLEAVRTAEAQLGERAELDAGLDGPLGQLARLALPGAAGEQAALLGDGFEALAFSSAGEVPLAPEAGPVERLDPEPMGRIGAAVLATVGALDSRAQAPDRGPETYLLISENVLPGWTLGLLALTLLVPPAALAVSHLARAGRRGEDPGLAWRWAARWAAVPLAGLLVVYPLALIGLIPRPPVPFDPGRFELGVTEAIALVAIAGAAAAAWWLAELRRVPRGPSPATLASGCALVIIAGCLLAWLANPFLALLLVPFAHLIAVHGARPQVSGLLAPTAALAAGLPLLAALVHVGSALDWGASAPWQLVLLVAGGGAGMVETAACLAVLAASAALVWASVRRVPVAPEDPDRGADEPAPRGETPAAV